MLRLQKLTKTYKTGDQALKALSKSNRLALIALDCCGLPITDDGVITLIQSRIAKKLQNLTLKQCLGLTGKVLTTLLHSHIEGLKHLVWTGLIGQEKREELAERFSGIQIKYDLMIM